MSIADQLKERARSLRPCRPNPVEPGHVAPISIVVPGRNVEKTVKRALDSVLDQTSDRWELVFVDDGSTDATAEIVEVTVGGRANVQIVKGTEEGVSAARNLGTELATLDFVLYLDADDWIDSRFIERMGSALARDRSLAGVRCIWAYETPDGRTQAWDDLDLSDLFAAAAERCPFAIHACVIDRQLVLSLGGFDPGLVVGEDWDLWQRVGRAGAKLGFVPEVMAFYHMRMESVMHCDLARSQSDLLVVASRGTKPDPRVEKPLPQYRDGLPLDPLIDLEAETLAGTLAVAIPTGTDFASLLPPHPPDPAKTITSDHIAGAMHESVAFGSCALLEDWADLYPRWESRIHEMLNVLCGWLRQPDMVYDVLRELESIVATTVDFDGLHKIGRTAVQRIDLRHNLRNIDTPEGVDQFVAAVRCGDVSIGFVRVPVVDGVVLANELSSTISTQLGPKMVTRARKDLRLAGRLASGLLNMQTLKSSGRFLLDTSWSKRAGSRDTADQFLRWLSRSAAAAFLDGRIPANNPGKPSHDQSADAQMTADGAYLCSDDIYGDPHINRMALWGGATVLRPDVYANEVGYQLPILMYHRVSPTGLGPLEPSRVTLESFEEQLNFLRANGYYGITFEQWQDALHSHRSLPGRPVLLTFDGGYSDFFEHAWPILRDYDFPAVVFVVADLVGDVASWDRRYTEPPSLMSWDEIRYVQSQGIQIGSHTACHHPLTSLTPSEALAQELRAQQIFRRELGSEISVIAYPFGEYDEVVEATMIRAGYETAVTAQGWLATVWHNPMALPRIDIVHNDDLRSFEAKLGNRGTVNPLRRGLRAARLRTNR